MVKQDIKLCLSVSLFLSVSVCLSLCLCQSLSVSALSLHCLTLSLSLSVDFLTDDVTMSYKPCLQNKVFEFSGLSLSLSFSLPSLSVSVSLSLKLSDDGMHYSVRVSCIWRCEDTYVLCASVLCFISLSLSLYHSN